MVEYFCAGYVMLSGGVKGITFYRYTGFNEIDKNDELSFTVSKNHDYPVGWIIDIIEDKKTGKYGDFKHVNEIQSGELYDYYRLRSITEAQKVKMDKKRKNALRKQKDIEGMTIAELKDWAKKSHINKGALRTYLQELF